MEAKQFEKISRALSDPHRIEILQAFKNRKECLPCTEVHDFIDLAQPSISHHLKQLVDADLLLPEKEGRNIKYRLNEEVVDSYIRFMQAFKNNL
jgi:ArsR family transcriptional regulator